MEYKWKEDEDAYYIHETEGWKWGKIVGKVGWAMASITRWNNGNIVNEKHICTAGDGSVPKWKEGMKNLCKLEHRTVEEFYNDEYVDPTWN